MADRRDRGLDLSRREMIVKTASALAGLAALQSPLAHAATGTPIRISEPTPGSAGRIWKPLIDRHQAGGLNLQWVGATPGQGQVQLAAGTVDVAFYGAIGATLINQNGGDIVIFGPSLNNHGRWIVRGDSPYRTPRDLVGKRIATQAESSETYLQARMAAGLHGIDLKKDVQVIFGPPAANLALFERGDVEGVIVLEPTATRLVARGARQIAKVGDMWREKANDDTPLFLVGLAARRQWLDANPAAAKTLVGLFNQIYQDVRARPQILAEQYGAYGIPAAERNVIDLLPQRVVDIYATDWGPAVFANIDKQVDFAVQLGLVKNKPAQPFYQSV